MTYKSGQASTLIRDEVTKISPLESFSLNTIYLAVQATGNPFPFPPPKEPSSPPGITNDPDEFPEAIPGGVEIASNPSEPDELSDTPQEPTEIA
ncbi:hypothetical protein [Nostoc sp. TCL26-01]|uniref:hypothetical protein n=1 Tax=Nostoc sp. TCL26-01 TaxID=2576904 RepID=UPI0015BC624A|nr:hypothetical protein [Nostoc sp. TCL26-01]QLE56019.1 hypothetical protein FD725_11065 [Nostoc sp. TCL26-01]